MNLQLTETAILRVLSLAEYELAGGLYDDTGNGGEAFDDVERGQFCAAAQIIQHTPAADTGLPDNDILEDETGFSSSDYWLDSVTGYFLLRRLPEHWHTAKRIPASTRDQYALVSAHIRCKDAMAAVAAERRAGRSAVLVGPCLGNARAEPTCEACP